MKKMFVALFVLSFVLAACAPANVQTVVMVVTATSEPATPQTIIQVVTATGAAAAATDTPAPASAAAAPSDTPAPAEAATATLPPAVGASAFTNFVQTGDHFSLKCSPGQITLGATAIDLQHVKTAYVSYRLKDKTSGVATGWGAPVPMTGDDKGNYTINFSALNISPDFRLKNAWFDYQFIGLNASSNVVGRSPIFTNQVTFTFDCQ